MSRSYTLTEFANTIKGFSGFPSSKDEAWRFSKINRLLQHSFDEVCPSPTALPSFDDLHTLIIEDGTVSSHSDIDGVTITVEENRRESPHAFLQILKPIAPKRLKVRIDKALDRPLMLHYRFSQNGLVGSCVDICVAEGVAVSLIEILQGGQEGVVIMDKKLTLQADASVELLHWQDLDLKAKAVIYERNELAPQSQIGGDLFSSGSGFCQHFLEAQLQESATLTLSGMIRGEEEQHQVVSARIEHLGRSSVSLLEFKELLFDAAVAVFDAKSIIRNSAEGAQARQSSKALLLSDKATVHTKPHLEIYTDSLQASHGVSVGALDKEALNYLQSRGLTPSRSRQLLIYVFVQEFLEKIAHQGSRELIQKRMGVDDASV